MAGAIAEKALKIADECWIALAKLSREEPARSSFSAREILDRVRRLPTTNCARASNPTFICTMSPILRPTPPDTACSIASTTELTGCTGPVTPNIRSAPEKPIPLERICPSSITVFWIGTNRSIAAAKL